MFARPAHERYASLSWLIVAMTVAAFTIGAIAARYVESRLVAFLGDTPALATTWLLVWLPMIALGLWFTARLKKNLAQAAEANYRQLVEQAQDIIYRTDAQGRFTFVNPITSHLTGHPEDQLLGRRFVEFIRPDAREATERFYGRQFVRKTPSTYYEFPAITRDGRELWFGQNVQTLIEDGRVIGFHAVARDITERKRLEDRLRATQYAVDHAADQIFVIGKDGYFLDVNESACRRLGYTKKELLTMSVMDIDPDFPPAVWNAVWSDFKNKKLLQLETRHRSKSGEIYPVEITANYILHNGQELDYAIVRDITERKRSEMALRESEGRFRAIIDKSPVPFALNDEEHNITYLNEAFIKTFGYDQTDIPTLEEWWTHAYPDPGYRKWVADTWRTRLEKAKKEKLPFEPLEVTVRSKDGTMRTVLAGAVSLFGSYENVHLVSLYDITERKRAEEALAAGEKRLRTILDAEPECVKVLNEEGILLDMNAAGLAMIEADSLEQVRGQSVCPMVVPVHRDAFAEFNRRVFQGQPGTMQYEIVGLKGTRRWMDTHAVPLRNEHNAVIGILAITRDITARMQAEGEIQRARVFLGSIVENIPNMVFVKDAKDLRFIEFNKAGEELLGYRRQDLIGRNDYDFFSKEEADFFTAKDREVLESKRLLDILEEPIKTKDRGIRILHTRKIPILDSDGRPQYLLGISEDITERKRAELVREHLVGELEESLRRFEKYFRETPSAISITTVKEGRFLDVNKQAEVLTGYSREELLGRTTTEMNLYVDPNERSTVVERLKEKGVLTNLERQIRTKSGEIRTAIFSLVPIEMGAEPCMLAIAHDITERKRAEQELRERSRQQAIEAELSLQAVTVQDLSALLDTAVKLVANALEVDYCEALELLPNGGGLRLYASAGWKGDRIGQERTLEPGSLARAALESNKPVVRSLPADTQFGGPPWLRQHGAVGGMSVCLPGKDVPWGVLGVYTAGARGFSRDDINFIQTVASILAAAIERMETEGVLRNANQALRLLSRQLLQVQEDERRTIARDLHDEIGQSLTAIKLNVERAQRTPEQAARRRIMQDCIQITERVLGQVRNLSLDLHPSILDDLGLTYALKWYADRLAERAGVRVEVTPDPSLPRLSQDVEIVCFRIAQEALTNVVRHAHASRADITLKRGAAAVELCIQDDGIGFTADTASSPSSVGLASMQERAKLLGGTIRIVSVPRGGTKVIATLPLLVASPNRMPAEEVPRS